MQANKERCNPNSTLTPAQFKLTKILNMSRPDYMMGAACDMSLQQHQASVGSGVWNAGTV